MRQLAVPTQGSRLARWRSDGIAGLINAVVSVPDGLASAALAGVNPVYGLYTSIAAPIGGSMLLSTQLMQIATTSAAALAAGQVVAAYAESERDQAMFLLSAITGLFLVTFGILRLGRLVRFVSHAVITGFLMGVAVVLILDQFAPLVGVRASGTNELLQFVDLLRNVSNFHWPTVLTGLAAVSLLIAVGRTRFATVSSLVAVVVPSALVTLLGWSGVQLVHDVSPIQRGVPIPAMPDLSLMSFDLLLSAFTLATIIAVQGAGVSQTVENPDGTRGNASRDLIAQGAAGVLSGLMRGIPAGGSVGQTALNVSVGARSRWAGVFGGLWVLLFLMLVPSLVGAVPMAVLAALMIAAGLSAIDVREAWSILNTGGPARWTIAVTFLATLLLSIPVAVGIGVLLTIVLYVATSAMDVTVRELIPLDDGRLAEAAPPRNLRSAKVTILDVHGSLFFAGARTLSEALPDPLGTQRPVVVLRLRGRTSIGATLIDILEEYVEDVREAGGRVYLSGVTSDVTQQLRRSGKFDLEADLHIMPAGEILGDSTRHALRAATVWLEGTTESNNDETRSLPSPRTELP